MKDSRSLILHLVLSEQKQWKQLQTVLKNIDYKLKKLLVETEFIVLRETLYQVFDTILSAFVLLCKLGHFWLLLEQ